MVTCAYCGRKDAKAGQSCIGCGAPCTETTADQWAKKNGIEGMIVSNGLYYKAQTRKFSPPFITLFGRNKPGAWSDWNQVGFTCSDRQGAEEELNRAMNEWRSVT
jgi:hypothetical protein